MFKNIIKKKELINREVEIYKKEQFFAIDKAIENYRSERQNEIYELAKQGYEELGKYEHTYHYSKEQKGIELARLQSKNEALAEVVKSREEVIKSDQNLLDSKNSEIKRLNDIVNLLISKQQQHTTTIQQLK